MESNRNMKKQNKKGVVPHQGLNAMPFRTKARKCNHWATGGLLEVGSKFNGTYMHMRCNCIDSLSNPSLENVL